jgi:hypothetical protein
MLIDDGSGNERNSDGGDNNGEDPRRQWRAKAVEIHTRSIHYARA